MPVMKEMERIWEKVLDRGQVKRSNISTPGVTESDNQSNSTE